MKLAPGGDKNHQAPSNEAPTSELFNGFLEAYLIIPDVLESVADYADAHVHQVGRGHLKHILGKLLAVLVNFLQKKPETDLYIDPEP